MSAVAAPPPSPLLRLERVGKGFGSGPPAIADISLELREGEFLALLGPSGCGKTTLLRLIAGLTQPSTGRIAWAEGAGGAAPGYVFQDPTLMPWATVADNVWLPLRLQGQRRAQAAGAVAEALALVGLSDVADAYPRALSGGMRMRAAIARALVTRPRLVLMDEPFAALDEITRFRLNRELLEIRARTGATVIFVTHSVFESVYLADRIAVMTPQPGRIDRLIAIDAPTPRPEGFRNSERYAACCREVSAALRQAMAVEA
ncbi:MAG: ABC transporter ATP-binding protein [Alphaproteobacteria bacterium]|nr:MAG: ABC transporter ATP-binding protein [Alphaproteobacteria bacterium]